MDLIHIRVYQELGISGHIWLASIYGPHPYMGISGIRDIRPYMAHIRGSFIYGLICPIPDVAIYGNFYIGPYMIFS